MEPLRKTTSSSKFGVSKREGHDATRFYSRFPAPEVSDDSHVARPRNVDHIFLGDARQMDGVADASVALVVTSPPYFAGKEYEEALGVGHVPGTYVEYLQMLEAVFAECVRKLEPGGRIAVNVANLGRKPYRSLASDVITLLQDRLRLLLRGEVVWQKARSTAGSCAWGSFQHPANPVLRDVTERVIIASKGRFDRALAPRRRLELGLPSVPSVGRDEFMEATVDLWEIPAESATRVGHPAPFPVALPERLIHLYTYRRDLVLDPFMGSGTTAVAAIRAGRHYIGYETDAGYLARARERAQREVAETWRAPEEGDGQEAGASPSARTQTPGEALGARQAARAMIEASGFRRMVADARLKAGMRVTFQAEDENGTTWLFEVCGGFTNHRPGLQRTDLMWKALGKALVLHELYRDRPLVILTPEKPPEGTSPDLALKAVCGVGKPVRAILRLSSEEDREKLRLMAAGSSG